jgi:hypothetical protein
MQSLRREQKQWAIHHSVRTVINKNKHKSIKYVPESEYKKYVNRWNFYDAEQIGNTYEIVMLKKKVKQDMPIQVGCSVFDDSKLRMYQFYYDCIDKYISRDDFQYMYCDTDSAYMALTGEFESLIKPELKAEFEKEKYNWFPREANREDKRKPGLFKVEFEGDGMVALCSKSYYVWRSGGKNKFSCKGVNKNRTPLAKEQYINCLTMNKFEKAINMGFRVDKKRIKTYTQEKIALTPIYTKGVVLNNGVNIAPLDF